ncbi:PspA/IM30 family protein [Dyella tabacisoli]|uniref:PspA/IM30 family protein n=1 Tax=Dyella tabacisoli TaxID=2282381 RepID=A0A369UPV0_9GAMM|nr:PspA/IM30 family protein [Dyella tabacisoli]RDD81748.1 PspA/IM30 family protein [Dyella tabacisoli]
MTIFDKLFTLVRGTATEAGQSIVDANALTILDQEIRDADNALRASRVDLTKLMAERTVTHSKLLDKQAKLQENNSYIPQLLAKNQRDLALEVSGKIAALEGDIAQDQKTIGDMDANIAKLQASIKQAEMTIDRLKRQVDTVKATASVQRAQEAIAAKASGSNARLRTAVDSLDRIKEQQALKSAQIDAANQLDSQANGGELEQKLQAAGIVPGGQAAEDILARFEKPASPTGNPS